MDELIGRLATNASIDSAVAETVGIIPGFLHSEGPSESVQVLIDQIPGAEAVIEASESCGGLSRLMGGGLMAVGTRLGLACPTFRKSLVNFFHSAETKSERIRWARSLRGRRASANSL